MKHIQEISARYVLPTIEEKTAYGFKRLDPYTKLFEERIIFMGQPIDDTVANDVMALIQRPWQRQSLHEKDQQQSSLVCEVSDLTTHQQKVQREHLIKLEHPELSPMMLPCHRHQELLPQVQLEKLKHQAQILL